MLKKDRWQRYLMPVLFAAVDYMAVVLAMIAAISSRNALDTWSHATYTIHPIYIFLWTPLFFLAFLKLMHTYKEAQPIIDLIRRIFYAVVNGLITSILLLYLFKLAGTTSRLFFVFFAVYVLLFILVGRYALLKFFKTHRYFCEPIILIGAGLTAERLIRFFQNDLGYRYVIIGYIDDNPKSKIIASKYRRLGGFDKAPKIFRRVGISTALIAAPGLCVQKLVSLIASIQPYVRNIAFVPDLIGTPMVDVEVDMLFSEQIPLFHFRNNLARFGNRLFKRAFDVFGVVVGGALISPILLILAVIVFIDNRGSMIFAHRRVGREGKEFPCYKFQTMKPMAKEEFERYLDAHPEARREWDETFKLENDPRVTRLGAFLRRTSLDELPQLWNVLTGDMSLVGPRPIVHAEVPRYGEHIKEYYEVRPGITGMWQVSGRSDTTYEERVMMDTWYVRNWSVWIDLVYLFKTIKAVAVGKGAY